MNSVQTRSLSSAQKATWSLPDADPPLLSWPAGAITPDQFFRPATNPTVVWGGARQLLLAVLDNAVEAVFRYRTDHSRRGRRLFKETLDWFWSADRQWLYSFENICAHLNVDADYLRRGLERLSDPAGAPVAPFLSVQDKSGCTHYPRTVRHSGNEGRNGQSVSRASRTRSSASK